MKLQNLIYATMVACAFSACSNDDDPTIPDPDPDTPDENDETWLSIQINVNPWTWYSQEEIL